MSSILGVEEIKDMNLWKSLGAECLGTGFLVLVGCGSTAGGSIIEMAVCFGLIVGLMVQCICHISGGHINPAVTFGMLVTGNCSIIRTILYVIAQLIGSILGAAILVALLPSKYKTNVGVTKVAPDLSSDQGFGIELMITFVLVFTVFAVVDSNRTDVKGSAPIIIGLSVTACHVYALKFTGSSMNTARSFGPALISNSWEGHWVYWLGPIIGGILAGLLYKYVFSANKENASGSVRQEISEQESEPRV